MKRIKYVLFMMLAAHSMLSCDIHTSDNGQMDGFWQLTQTDTLSNGRSEDMRDRKIFWSVQSNLLKMEELLERDAYHTILYRFEQHGDLLRVYDPIVDRRDISDSIVHDVQTVRHYGLDQLDQTLRIVYLEDSKMALETERLRMYFRKY